MRWDPVLCTVKEVAKLPLIKRNIREKPQVRFVSAVYNYLRKKKMQYAVKVSMLYLKY